MNRFAKARLPHPDDAVPSRMPDRALDCAIRACGTSVHASDREFALACQLEPRRRWVAPPAAAKAEQAQWFSPIYNANEDAQ